MSGNNYFVVVFVDGESVIDLGVKLNQELVLKNWSF